MDRSLATLSLSEAEARVAAATPADANTAPLQLQAEAAHHLQRLDAKLLSWLERSDEEDDEDVLEPETHAERQLAQLCAQAAEKNLTSAYVLACVCIHRSLYQQALGLLKRLLGDPLLQRDPLLQLNSQFQMGVLLYDGLAEGDSDENERVGFDTMLAIASLNPSDYEQKGPVDQPPEELSLATDIISSAQYNVGRAYFEGVGVEQDDEQALGWWCKAAAEGLPSGSHQAQNALGVYFGQQRRLDPTDPLKIRNADWNEAFSWHKAAAANGNVDSQCRLGLLYRNGEGTRSNAQEALMWLKKAAMAGHDIAETELAAHYYTMRLYNKSVQWAKLVCEPIEDSTAAGIAQLDDDLRCARASACWHLARCFSLGVGVDTKSPALADKYMQLALRHDVKTVAALQRKVVSMEIA